MPRHPEKLPILAAFALVLQVSPCVAAPESLAAGLVCAFETVPPSSPAGSRARDHRVTRLAALYVPQGRPATPFLPPGPFKATFSGYLEVEFSDDYEFAVEGRGKVTLKIADKIILRAAGEDLSGEEARTVELEGGKNRLVLEYESPSEGDARLRLNWASFEFSREPLSPQILFHDPASAALQAAQQLRQGRFLLATRRCLKCHRLPLAASEHTMPELAMDAPSLEGIGDRVHEDWLAYWLTDPRKLRPGATMPRLFHPPAGTYPDPRARDIAAYLCRSEVKKPPAGAAAALESFLKRASGGAGLYESLGCMSCHLEPSLSPDGDEHERTSLRFVKAKWKPAALRDFLLEPERHYKWIRMPNYRLSVEEASALAGFLLSRDAPSLDEPTPDRGGVTSPPDPKNGRELVETSGCLNCHPLKSESRLESPSFAALRKGKWTSGCLAASSEGEDGAAARRAPDFSFSSSERTALVAIAATDLSSLGRRSAVDFASRQMKILRCAGCHTRDGQIDVWSALDPATASAAARAALEAAAGAPPEPRELLQFRPHLTWVGEKLQTPWLSRFLAGEVPYRTRPWLRARMPSFASRARLLTVGLALQHGERPFPAPLAERDEEAAEFGRRLVAQQGGFNCVSCHDVGESSAVGVFDVKGPNFTHVAQRLRKEFFHRWMRNPIRVEPESKMPQFADDEGRSPITDIYGGDARKQFEAIWQYLLAGEKIKPPGG